MPQQIVNFQLVLGEQSDKPEMSGQTIMTEVRGLVPVLPADDAIGALQVLPGCRVMGDGVYSFIPGVFGEPGSETDEEPDGVPAATPEESIYYNRVRIVNLTDPQGTKGNIIAAFAVGTGEDPKSGQCLLLHNEQWGGRLPGGEKIRPFVTINVPVALVSPDNAEEFPGFGCPAAVVEMEWSDVGATQYEVFVSYDDPTMPGMPTTTTTDTTYNYNALSYGTYYWWVTATYSNGEEITAGPRTFVVVSE